MEIAPPAPLGAGGRPPPGVDAHDAVVVVGDTRFQQAMLRAPAFSGRLVVCVSATESLDRAIVLAGATVVASAEACRQVARFRWPEFPGAAMVYVVDAADADPIESPLSVRQRALKRTFDVVAAVALLVLTVPLVLLLALAVRCTTGEPGFFVQERVGVGGRRFRIRKVRSMVTADDAAQRAYMRALIRGEAEPVEGMFKLVDDERITSFGRWLRRLSLDELPQLWNVVRGDMSLVGPRPPLPSEVAYYDAQAWQRLRVKPGITGPWQVSGRSTLSFAQMIELDVAYWQSWSLARDLAIAVRTPLEMLSGRGAG